MGSVTPGGYNVCDNGDLPLHWRPRNHGNKSLCLVIGALERIILHVNELIDLVIPTHYNFNELVSLTLNL